MARPRKLTAAQEQQIGALSAEVGPREASRQAPALVGCEVSPASCLKFQRAGAGPASAAPEAPAPLRPEPAPEAAPLPQDADDLDVLLHLRELASRAALSAGEKRLLLAAIDRVASLTERIVKMREQKAPSRKVGLLILPPEQTE